MLIETDELLEILYVKFPDVVPDKVADMRGLGKKIGEQTVMKYIEHVVDQKEHESKQKAKKAVKK